MREGKVLNMMSRERIWNEQVFPVHGMNTFALQLVREEWQFGSIWVRGQIHCQGRCCWLELAKCIGSGGRQNITELRREKVNVLETHWQWQWLNLPLLGLIFLLIRSCDNLRVTAEQPPCVSRWEHNRYESTICMHWEQELGCKRIFKVHNAEFW